MNSDARAAMRGLVRQLCEAVAREMQLQAEIRRLERELQELKAVKH